MSGPVCLTETATSKPSKPPHHRSVRRQKRPAAARCIFVGSEACSSIAALDRYCWWKTPAPTPKQWSDILLSAACRATLHPPPPLYRGRGARAGQASLEFLSFDGVGGGVQACNQTHCLYNQLPVRQIQAVLSCRQTDSVLFGKQNLLHNRDIQHINTDKCTIGILQSGNGFRFVHWN